MKKYALLYFQQIKDKFSKWVFPLHHGENIIGSDKDVDIFLYLNEKEDKIDSVHCKIMLNELQNDVGIISLASNGYVKREENEEKIILSPGKEYELNNKTHFYLTDNIKFTLIKGTIEEIHNFLLQENLEHEFQKWHQYILTYENNMKVKLNLSRKESYNKSVISNISNDDYKNINIDSFINNNNLLNSAKSKKNLNNIISNSILSSNNKEINKEINKDINKEINRIGFNSFDEFPDDNIINDYKILYQNSTNNKNIKDIKKNLINLTHFKIIDKETPQKNELKNSNNIDNNINNIKNYKVKQLSTEITNNNFIINEKETEINSMRSENIFNFNRYNNNEDNKDYNGIINNNKLNDDYNNSFELFKQTISEVNKNNNINYNENCVNKDEKTIQTIKELLGDNNLDIIIKNTNLKDIKKYDIIFKKEKNNKYKGMGNIDINFINNDFLRNNIKFGHKNENKK